MERWSGKVAVVTGASVGIGAAIVRKLLNHGLIVVGLARRVEKIKELIDDPVAKLHAVECDITNEENVITAFAWIKENLGNVDVLVNNAGITKEATLLDGSLKDWRSVIDVNVLGLCTCTREAVRSMLKTEKECIVIHVSSLAGDRVPAVPGFNVYPATKRAIKILAETLRQEVINSNVRVSTISPGFVATDLLSSYASFTPDVLTTIPSLQPNDVAEAVIFILSLPSHVMVEDISIKPVGEVW